jgi:hypothetical protein
MPALGNPQDYSIRNAVFINGVPMEQVTSVEMTLDTGITEIFTTTQGLAGFASGAKMVTIRCTQAVPISGPEDNTWNRAMDEEYVTVQIGVGRVDFAGQGKMINAGTSNSVNNPVEWTWEWHGQPGKLE